MKSLANLSLTHQSRHTEPERTESKHILLKTVLRNKSLELFIAFDYYCDVKLWTIVIAD